jgi:hypothetical protein
MPVVVLLSLFLIGGCGVKSDPVPYLSVYPPETAPKPVTKNPNDGVKPNQ